MFEGILQPAHLLLILAIVLIVFGPGKLPELGKALGQMTRDLRSGMETPAPPEPPASPSPEP